MRFTRTDPLVTRLRAFGLSDAAAKRLVGAGTPVNVTDGVDLCVEGARGEEAFLLLDGAAVVHLPDHDVRVGPGDVIGERAALDPFVRRNATVTTDGPCEVLVFDVRSFRSLAQGDLRSVLAPVREDVRAA
jgi:CRP-like cAMP-binding protein